MMNRFCRLLTKLSLARVVAVALLILGGTSVLAPALADHAPGHDEVARGRIGNLQTQLDYLALLASRQASAFVFMTSTTHTGDLGGVEGADDICNSLASAAGLPGAYKAWLATSSDDDPESTFYRAPGSYILPNGDLVALSWDDLTSRGALASPLVIDETGSVVTDPGGDPTAWTAVREDGTFNTDNWVSTCDGWTSDDSSGGTVGFGTGSLWSSVAENNCQSVPSHLFCFGQ